MYRYLQMTEISERSSTILAQLPCNRWPLNLAVPLGLPHTKNEVLPLEYYSVMYFTPQIYIQRHMSTPKETRFVLFKQKKKPPTA
jgi:hypothetical protein